MSSNTYKKFSTTKKHFAEISKIHKMKVYIEGKKAFDSGVSPDHCPYLNRYGDNSNQITDWMLGWSNAYREYAESGFTPAWNDELGAVLGT